MEPFGGPWGALGLAVLCAGLGLGGIRLVVNAYSRDPRSWEGSGPRPPWYRLRVIGYQGVTLVPGVWMLLSFAGALPLFALFLATDLDLFGVLGTLLAGAGILTAAWGIVDSFLPRNGRDEYDAR
ncbi:MAG: hypothetical protein NTV23_11915 [Propionibacteriales bacterium]|nr:hypothetical protein [Propionibacteriales bacterium]